MMLYDNLKCGTKFSIYRSLRPLLTFNPTLTFDPVSPSSSGGRGGQVPSGLSVLSR